MKNNFKPIAATLALVLSFVFLTFTSCRDENKKGNDTKKDGYAMVTDLKQETNFKRPDKAHAQKEIDAKFRTVSKEKADKMGCVSCHEGIQDFRDPNSAMMQMIFGMGKQHNDPKGCVVCHGGKPNATTYEDAHSGIPKTMKDGPKEYYPDPGSLWIADKTCGQSAGCHSEHVYNLSRALMSTEAGKIQGNLHTWGVKEVQYYNVPWGNYDVKDPDGKTPKFGTETYKKYMAQIMKDHPKQFPDELKQIPLPSVDEIEKDPHLAGFTYQRQQCQRCHVNVRGREKRGDYRGMGCSSCHTIYGNEGYYEGTDPTINKGEQGHMLTHQAVGTRKTKYKHNGLEFSGVPVETCNSCHNRGKRIGVTYQGLMEFPYGTPFTDEGSTQPKLHTKKYLFISDDLHHQIDQSRKGNPKGGMLCQDCHTSIDMHGDGNIFGTTLAQVEIECQDCHGTTDEYPWELPIGYSEEFNKDLSKDARGLAQEPSTETTRFATVYDKKDGYLLSTRGNALGNVVKDGNKVMLHSATGKDFEVPVLKQIKTDGTWKSMDAMVAMDKVKKHNEKLECYTCHASWVPQCYGCHVQVDYSKGKNGKPKMDVDWIASGSEVDKHGQTAESHLGTPGIKSPGKVREGRSYLRWEEPILGVNGEGRITPLMPGCQIVYSVIDRNGKRVADNVIDYAEDEAIAANQKHKPLNLDMSPVQPHSAQRKARSCESCHNNPKSMGYGIGGGVFQTKSSKDIVEDLIDQSTGKVIPKNYKIQIEKVPTLNIDWSVIVDKDGNQTQVVGSHWPLSRALNKTEREGMDRTGLCMGCHREMTNQELWKKVATSGTMNMKEHIEKMNKFLHAAAGK